MRDAHAVVGAAAAGKDDNAAHRHVAAALDPAGGSGVRWGVPSVRAACVSRHAAASAAAVPVAAGTDDAVAAAAVDGGAVVAGAAYMAWEAPLMPPMPHPQLHVAVAAAAAAAALLLLLLAHLCKRKTALLAAGATATTALLCLPPLLRLQLVTRWELIQPAQ